MQQFAAGAINPRPQAQTPTTGIEQPVGFWDSARLSFDNQRAVRNDGVRETQYLEQMWARHRQVERALGRPVPLSQTLVGQSTDQRDSLERALERVIPTDRINAWILGRPGGALADDAYEARLDAMRREFPDQLRAVETRDQLRERLSRSWIESEQRAGQAAGTGLPGQTGAFAGSMAGAMVDPPNAAAALLTGGAGAGRTLVGRMLVQGAIGAGLEGLSAPERMVEAERYGGPEYTGDDAVADVLFGAAGGAAFEGIGAAARATARPIAEALRSPSSARAGRAMVRELERAARDFGRAADDPALRGAAARMDALDLDALIVGKPGAETAEDAARALDDMAPLPAVEPEADINDLLGPATGETLTYQGRPIRSGRFDPMAVEADPARFQYKEAGPEGVTDRLAGVETWDPAAAGRSLLFERRDGSVVVADGHQRRALARRLIETGRDTGAVLDGFVFREADGWRPEEVRVVAALKNLREGSGSILDAAKVFRDAPTLLEDRSLPVTGDFIANARGLARLSDEAFGAVISGVVPERYGAVIGSMAPDRPDMHEGMVGLLHRAGPRSVDEARALVTEGLHADFVRREGATGDLFGNAPEESTVIARAQLRAAVLKQLRGDAKLFGSLIQRADAIEVGGNVLARDANELRVATDMAAMALVDRLALRDSDVGAVFGAAARQVATGELRMSAAVGRVVEGMRRAADDLAALDRFREETIAPSRPSEAFDSELAAFSDPSGPGARGQLEPKPEDAALEQGNAPAGLFDDLMLDEAEERAIRRLAPCAPGGAA